MRVSVIGGGTCTDDEYDQAREVGDTIAILPGGEPSKANEYVESERERASCTARDRTRGATELVQE